MKLRNRSPQIIITARAEFYLKDKLLFENDPNDALVNVTGNKNYRGVSLRSIRTKIAMGNHPQGETIDAGSLLFFS